VPVEKKNEASGKENSTGTLKDGKKGGGEEAK